MDSDEPRSRGERALSRLLEDSHLAPADRLPEVMARAAAELGAREASVLIVDHQQTQLVDVSHRQQPVPLEGSVAGRVYRQGIVEEVEVADGRRLWLPMLDGIERVGVLGLTFGSVDAALAGHARRLASLLAELLLTKRAYSDALHRAARRQKMSLAAEMQWELLPPLTAGTERVTVAAMLEPAYDVGGDLVDYALQDRVASVAIFDAMGHGLDASVCSAVAVGAYRNSRREGGDLRHHARTMEDALWDQFRGERFATAILAELDVASGRLRWINAGHPPPLLLRGGRVVKQLAGEWVRPAGLGLNDDHPVNEEALEPADRVMLYTDGVIENRPAGQAEQFGLERLVEFLVRADASGEQLSETMRRLSRTLVDHHGGTLRDDASQLLLEWRTGSAVEIHDRFAGARTEAPGTPR